MTSAVKFHYMSLQDYITTIIHDIEHVDAELHHQFPGTPYLQTSDVSLDGIGNIRKGYSINPTRAIAYQEDGKEEGGDQNLLAFWFNEKLLYPSDFIKCFVT